MDVPPADKPSSPQFRYRRYGVYDVVYEDSASPLTLRIYALLDMLHAIRVKLPAVRRLLADTLKIAPAAFVAYMVTAVWRGVYHAIILYWLIVLFDMLGAFLMQDVVSTEGFRLLAASWIIYTMINIHAHSMDARSHDALEMRFRAYFIPRLMRASMKLSPLFIQDLYTLFPLQGRFASEFPGGRFLTSLSQLIRQTLDVTCQVFVLLHATSRKPSPEREILLCFCIARGIALWLAPPNGIGSLAYVYLTHNRHFQRMKTLFVLAFSTQYRPNLVLDGMANSIETEYSKAAGQLGNINTAEPTPWSSDLGREWHWLFLFGITSEHLLAIYALLFSGSLSPSTVSSMLLLHKAAISLSTSIGRYVDETPSLLDVCSHAKCLYDAIDYEGAMLLGTEPYPRPIDGTYDAGMKISFRDVSLRYPECAHDALHSVSFDILPGELVLIVGANGSGKSTVLNLLAGLFEPSVGEVWVDDVPRGRYEHEVLRRAVVFQAQVPTVYPGSVRENIALGLSRGDDSAKDGQDEQIEAAARIGGCTEWIARLDDGYETQLRPSFPIDNGWMDGIFGYPSKALLAELARQRGKELSLSGGEKLRLATARTFMRLTESTRLLLVDEATSALDPVAEQSVLAAIRQARAGKTVILVVHRFHHLAHIADRILCMKAGSVIECGTHDELLRLRGEYDALYHAQVDRSGAR